VAGINTIEITSRIVITELEQPVEEAEGQLYTAVTANVTLQPL